MGLDFGRSFSFIFEDEGWIRKVLIGGAIYVFGSFLFGLGGIVVAGWVVEIVRRVSSGADEPLPDWDNFGGYFMDGIKLVGTSFLWALPIILLSICPALLGVAAGMMDDPDMLLTITSITSICIAIISVLYAIVLSLLVGSLLGLIAENQPFSYLVNPRNAWNYMRANVGGYLLALIVGGFIAQLVGGAGVILCGIGVILTMPIGAAFFGHLFGQSHMQTMSNLALPSTAE
jgi:hypothetical protein